MYDELVKRLRSANAVVFRVKDLTLMSEAADAIEELSKPCWISVKERLPEASGHYLVCIECKCDGESFISWMQVALFYEKFYWGHQYGDDIFNETVTHWMPLPEPPKEE